VKDLIFQYATPGSPDASQFRSLALAPPLYSFPLPFLFSLYYFFLYFFVCARGLPPRYLFRIVLLFLSFPAHPLSLLFFIDFPCCKLAPLPSIVMSVFPELTFRRFSEYLCPPPSFSLGFGLLAVCVGLSPPPRPSSQFPEVSYVPSHTERLDLPLFPQRSSLEQRPVFL